MKSCEHSSHNCISAAIASEGNSKVIFHAAACLRLKYSSDAMWACCSISRMSSSEEVIECHKPIICEEVIECHKSIICEKVIECHKSIICEEVIECHKSICTNVLFVIY